MKFTDLILPKWKNSNPGIRLKAVKSIDCDNKELLEKILTSDTSPEVRLSVLKKITTETLIEKTAKNDADEAVRSAASQMLNLIFAKKVVESNDLPTRREHLDRIKDEDILASLFLKIESPDFRVSIIEKISTPKLLSKLAESNCGVKAGNKIVDQMDDIALLDRLSQKASSKKIRKKAAEKINSLKNTTMPTKDNAEREPGTSRKLTALCEEIESAVASNDLKYINTLIKKGEKIRVQTMKDPDSELFARVNTGLTTLGNHSAELTTIKETGDQLEAVCREAANLSELPEADDNSKKQIDILCETWSTLYGSLATPGAFDSISATFKKAVAGFNEKYNAFSNQKEKEKEAAAALKSIITAAKALIGSDDIIVSAKDIAALKKKWALNYLESEEALRLSGQFTEAVKRCEEKIRCMENTENLKREEKRNTLLEIIRKASEEEENKLYKIAPDVKNVIKEWGKETARKQDELKNIEFQTLCDLFFDRLDAHNNKRDWELWANLSLKRKLCTTVEKIASLAENTDELSGVAKRIRDAQAEWKEIGPVSKDKSDEIWERFKAACDLIFALCLKEKEKLLAEAEEAVSLNNFNNASGKIIKIQQAWKQIGPLPLSIEKELRDSFSLLCDDFFTKKRAFVQTKDLERQGNYTLKLALCEQAETHLDDTDWHKTTEIYKKLQAEWKKTGPVPREKSDEIWERFSVACNTYFATLEKTKPENMKTKTRFCEEAELIAESIENGADIGDACKKIIDLQKKWHKTGPVPRELSDQLWDRFRAPCDIIFAIREEARKKRSVDQEKNREEKEALLHKAEVIAASPDLKSAADELKQIQLKWKEAGAASRKDEQELWTRFREINDSFFNSRRKQFQDREAMRDANLVIKENLCLQLELLAKILTDNSETGYNEKVPLAEQLSIARELRQHVDIPGDKKTTRTNIMRKVKELQKSWKETGAVPSELEKGLWQRYKKAGDLFYS